MEVILLIFSYMLFCSYFNMNCFPEHLKKGLYQIACLISQSPPYPPPRSGVCAVQKYDGLFSEISWLCFPPPTFMWTYFFLYLFCPSPAWPKFHSQQFL